MKPANSMFLALLAAALALSGCATPALMTPAFLNDGWTTLIDGGRGLENFNRINTANWSAADGAIQATQGGKEAAYLVSKNSYKDFMIRVEFWASDDANSGIFLRCANPNKITDDSCYEANIFDQRADAAFGTGSIVRVAKVAPMPKAGGKWNTYEMILNGPSLLVLLNGRKTVEVKDSKHASGPIALEWGRGVIKFRKVQIKPL